MMITLKWIGNKRRPSGRFSFYISYKRMYMCYKSLLYKGLRHRAQGRTL